MEIFDGRNEKIRLIIFSLSILWFIFGICCMLIGGQSHGIIDTIEQTFYLSELQIAGFALSLIPIGSLMVFISFFGCCAAIKGSRRMTFANLTVLYILALTKLAIACILFNKFSVSNIVEKVEVGLSEVLNRTVTENVTDKHRTKELFGNVTIFAETVHTIHETYQCCGVNGSDFYHADNVPHSCCIVDEECEDCKRLSRFHVCPQEQEKYNGCIHLIISDVVEAKTKMANFLITASIIEFIVGTFEFCITKNIKDI